MMRKSIFAILIALGGVALCEGKGRPSPQDYTHRAMCEGHSEYLKTGVPQQVVVSDGTDGGQVKTVPFEQVRDYILYYNSVVRNEMLAKITKLRDGSFLDYFGIIASWFVGTAATPLSDFFLPSDVQGIPADVMRLDAVDDLSFLENVLALARLAVRYNTDRGGFFSTLYEKQKDLLFADELARVMFSYANPITGKKLGVHPLMRNRFLDIDFVHRGDLCVGATNEVFKRATVDAFGYDSQKDKPEVMMKQITKGALLMKEIAAYANRLPTQPDRDAFINRYKKECEAWPTITSIVHYIPLDLFANSYMEYIQDLDVPLILVEVIDKPTLRTERGSHFVMGHAGILVFESARGSKSDVLKPFLYHVNKELGEVVRESLPEYLQRQSSMRKGTGPIGFSFLLPVFA